MRTQWRWAVGMAVRRLGLEYSTLPLVRDAIEAQIPEAHRQPWPVLFAQLQVMEVAALAADAE